MKRPHTNESHLTCPTCWSNLDNKDLEDLSYFSRSGGPLKNDDVANMYEEVSRLVSFLGALAQAVPLAVAQKMDEEKGMSESPQWTSTLSWLAEELAEEVERRLLLLENAGQIWKTRAEQATPRKEG